jgi:hypothetical protein
MKFGSAPALISILINSSSRKSQWYITVRKLLLGGGGDSISIESD